MSYGRLFIISRTNASYDGGIFLTGINQILGPHQSLATIVLVFILTVKNIGPANNDQSLCYAGYGAHLITIIARGHLVSAPVF
jgi:hypothetical protein